MLHTEAINPALFGILNELMNYPPFDDLLLVGGTSLALQLGHRESQDIDLFGKISLNNIDIEYLKSLGEFRQLISSKHINIFTIDGVKVDIVNYRYPWLNAPLIEEGIRLATKKDIAAMKYNAISGRGSKKDFIDLFYLLKEFTFEEMFQFYVEKYDDGNPWLVKKSLLYFKEADEETTPKLLEKTTWKTIKEEIIIKYKKEGYL